MEQIINFDQAVSGLNEIIAESSKITASDLKDSKQIAVVREFRLKLKKTRVAIEKQGKSMRDDAIKYQRDVIAREKELIGIIEPEEARLEAIEDEAQRIKDHEERMSSLPLRREQLAAIGDGVEVSDDELLDMDAEQFVAYMNGRKVAHFDKLEAQRKEDEARVAREAEMQRREESVKKEAEERAAREIAEANERAEKAEKAAAEAKEKAERQAKEDAEKAERARLAAIEEAERKEKQEKERLEKQAKYRKFRDGLGWTEETKSDFKEEKVGDEIIIWKKAGTFTIN
jgi:hypothetical protein